MIEQDKQLKDQHRMIIREQAKKARGISIADQIKADIEAE